MMVPLKLAHHKVLRVLKVCATQDKQVECQTSVRSEIWRPSHGIASQKASRVPQETVSSFAFQAPSLKEQLKCGT